MHLVIKVRLPYLRKYSIIVTDSIQAVAYSLVIKDKKTKQKCTFFCNTSLFSLVYRHNG
jgi:hypothetical protein